MMENTINAGVTRGVILDLLPLYLADEVSTDTRRLVECYLETDPPPGQEKLQGADASHAWFSAYIPGFGWLDFDPTNNTEVTDRHITVARGRDFDDVTPLKGIALGGGRHSLQVEVDVTRLDE